MTLVTRMLRAELLRLRAQRSTALVAAGIVLVTAAFVALAVGAGDLSDLRGEDGARSVLSIGGAVAYPAAYVLGVLGMAGDAHHRGLTRALLLAPARWPVVAAKAACYAAAGALAGLLAFATALAVAVPWTSARDVPIELGDGLPWLVGLGCVGAAALFGVIGVGVAALVRHQAVALAVGLAWILVVDVAAVIALSDVGRFLPGGAALSLIRAGDDGDALPMGAAALVLVGYAAALGAAGAVTLVRRRSPA